MLVEIRLHGRGGEGAVTAANLLASAAVREGKYAQAIPYFGAERRGAPVVAYARISDEPIQVHSRIEHPDIIIVLNPKLFQLSSVMDGAKENAIIIVNSKEKPKVEGPYSVYCVDATSIAESIGLVVSGWPVVNTVMLGAFSKVTGLVKLESIIEAVREQFSGRLGELNAAAITKAAESVAECK